ncbi:MAG: hypothetical protein V4516_16855 [Pseudomonadota bacterium]
MLTRRQMLAGLVAGATLAGGPALAQDYASEVERRLVRQGYRIEAVGRTLLGRVRILARNSEGEREIILNPRTGEILRDLWIARGSSDRPEVSGGDDGDGDHGNSGKGGGDGDSGDVNSGGGGNSDGGGDSGND